MNQAYLENSQMAVSKWTPSSSKGVASVFRQFQPEVARVPDMSAYEIEMSQYFVSHDDSLSALKKQYVFNPTEEVRSFLQTHRAVPEILLEAVDHLKGCFGSDALLELQTLEDESTPGMVYALVQWQGSFESARAALNRFDETWWISNAAKAAGRIVFDYQLV